MDKKILSVVPVAPYESLSTLKRSVNNLKDLRSPKNVELDFVYVIDSKKEKDEKVEFIEQLGERFKVLKREDSYKKRAGAIEYALEKLRSDLIAIFDIDSKPDPDFIEKALKEFDSEKHFIASARRYITNKDFNLTTEFVACEYEMISDLQELCDYLRTFYHFNGQIGLLDYDYVKEKGFKKRLCSDGDFSARAYLGGKKAKMVKETRIGEMAPVSSSDLYSQRVRWMGGTLELYEYIDDFLKSDLKLNVKSGFLLDCIMAYFPFLLAPLAIPYGLFKARREEIPLTMPLFLILSSFFFPISIISAIFKRTSSGIGWGKVEKPEAE